MTTWMRPCRNLDMVKTLFMYTLSDLHDAEAAVRSHIYVANKWPKLIVIEMHVQVAFSEQLFVTV